MDEPVELPRQPSLPPTTTYQQDVTLSGQRRVNLIWEYTQAALAVFVVTATLGISTVQVFRGDMEQIPTIFSAAFGLVVGFYFGRTNHAAIGGIGPKPQREYDGR